MLAALGPVLELVMRAQEAVVGQDLDLAGELVRPVLDGLLHPPFARFDDVDRARIVAFDCTRDFACKAARIVLAGELHVVDRPPGIAQFLGEVAHGREDQDDLLLVVLDVGRLVPDLHHQDDGIVLGAASKARKRAGQLVAKDGNENGLL